MKKMRYIITNTTQSKSRIDLYTAESKWKNMEQHVRVQIKIFYIPEHATHLRPPLTHKFQFFKIKNEFDIQNTPTCRVRDEHDDRDNGSGQTKTNARRREISEGRREMHGLVLSCLATRHVEHTKIRIISWCVSNHERL